MAAAWYGRPRLFQYKRCSYVSVSDGGFMFTLSVAEAHVRFPCGHSVRFLSLARRWPLPRRHYTSSRA